MIYKFTIHGTVESKELLRFVNFVEERYERLAKEVIEFKFADTVGIATLNTKRPMTEDKVEKCRFMLEHEFSKHFRRVRVEVEELPDDVEI
jgi:hypothetical protein